MKDKGRWSTKESMSVDEQKGANRLIDFMGITLPEEIHQLAELDNEGIVCLTALADIVKTDNNMQINLAKASVENNFIQRDGMSRVDAWIKYGRLYIQEMDKLDSGYSQHLHEYVERKLSE
jgi:hypothetical protein